MILNTVPNDIINVVLWALERTRYAIDSSASPPWAQLYSFNYSYWIRGICLTTLSLGTMAEAAWEPNKMITSKNAWIFHVANNFCQPDWIQRGHAEDPMKRNPSGALRPQKRVIENKDLQILQSILKAMISFVYIQIYFLSDDVWISWPFSDTCPSILVSLFLEPTALIMKCNWLSDVNDIKGLTGRGNQNLPV